MGFIKAKQKGSFDYKARHSTRWILTLYDYNGQPATKDFMRARPGENEKSRSQSLGPSAPTDRTERHKLLSENVVKLPHGPTQ